jgi:hypothetical protein
MVRILLALYKARHDKEAFELIDRVNKIDNFNDIFDFLGEYIDVEIENKQE